MFKLAYPIETEVSINGQTTNVDMSFDNILRLLDMLQDNEINELTKLDIALEMLLSARFLSLISEDSSITTVDKKKIFDEIMEKFVIPQKKEEQELIEDDPHDEYGEIDEDGEEKEANYYSITEDAEYIYPSFLQDYGIDLFEQQGKLHWLKFRSLLAGLREDTRFKKVVEIRQWEPDSDTTNEQRRQMRTLQNVYALDKSQEEQEFEAMDIIQKREYLKKKKEQKKQ